MAIPVRTPDPIIARFLEVSLPKIVQELSPQYVVLFGSRTLGHAEEGSDLDILIVSEAFEGLKFHDRFDLLRRILGRLEPVEPHCRTSSELRAELVVGGFISTVVEDALVLIGDSDRLLEDKRRFFDLEKSRSRRVAWLANARGHLDVAQQALGIRSYNLAAFHAHQCVELTLKALRIHRFGGTPERKHTLQELAEPLALPADLDRLLSQMSEDYIKTRYPEEVKDETGEVIDDIWAEYDEAMARERIEWARAIFAYAEKEIGGTEAQGVGE